MATKRYAEALALYAAVIKQFPQGGGEYGRAAADAGDYELAFRIWEKFRARTKDAEIIARLAGEYQNIGLHAMARELFAQAAGLEPGNLHFQLKLAAMMARSSSIDEARAAVGRCLEMNPGHEQARYLSACLDRRENKLAAAEQQLRDLVAARPRDPAVHYSCRSELALLLDRSGRFDEAADVLAEAKKLARQAFGKEAERRAFYERHENDIRQARALPKNILQTWAESFPARGRKAVPPLAFLSGAARSGTTLLERILDAHPALAAVDESPAFTTVRGDIPASLAAMPAQRLNVLRQRYLNNLTLPLGPAATGKILLDKNPSRTIWLPAFLRVFPELRVLIALRDPRDVIVSLYFQDHAMTNYLSWEELARHYSGVMDVWLAVREWEGLMWMETRYENIVAGLPEEGARVTKFLGLSWHENQAQFHERNREKPIMSTNYGDVTQPVYKRAVGRWRSYERRLAPILPALEKYGKMFGYT